MLSRDELTALIDEMRDALVRRIANEPSPERARYLIATRVTGPRHAVRHRRGNAVVRGATSPATERAHSGDIGVCPRTSPPLPLGKTASWRTC
ncbi:hypothetical protein San01_61470 [Streptomyces angustmyceticus]|uniref:Uncharacterized protein n=1 Tax=Streptomyces angustmyceticus TaxID=285578 RepID=A0A5J4LQ86_9ACTN|nr:hypothetical protein San01_61470 [Streptomyces angustmyceticus]